jgi:hypothetical protein
MAHVMMLRCFLCEQTFRYGGYRYDGERFPTLDIMVCQECSQENLGGLAPHYETKLRARLGESKWKVVDQSRNEKGRIPLR